MILLGLMVLQPYGSTVFVRVTAYGIITVTLAYIGTLLMAIGFLQWEPWKS